MKDDTKDKYLEFIVQNNIKITPTIPKGARIVCCLVNNFDYESDREIWELPINQSVETNYKCQGCDRAVVMSRWTKSEYERNETTNPLCCPNCLITETADA